MMRALLLTLLVAGPAMAQNAPDRTDRKADEKPQERPRLNLRLDDPASFARTSPETPPEKDLPSLGATARKIESGPSRTLPGSGPYPRGSPENP